MAVERLPVRVAVRSHRLPTGLPTEGEKVHGRLIRTPWEDWCEPRHDAPRGVPDGSPMRPVENLVGTKMHPMGTPMRHVTPPQEFPWVFLWEVPNQWDIPYYFPWEVSSPWDVPREAVGATESPMGSSMGSSMHPVGSPMGPVTTTSGLVGLSIGATVHPMGNLMGPSNSHEKSHGKIDVSQALKPWPSVKRVQYSKCILQVWRKNQGHLPSTVGHW